MKDAINFAQFSNAPAVAAAMRRAISNLVPTEDLVSNAEQDMLAATTRAVSMSRIQDRLERASLEIFKASCEIHDLGDVDRMFRANSLSVGVDELVRELKAQGECS